MKMKKLIAIGIMLVFLMVGLSGCMDPNQVECKWKEDEIQEDAIRYMEFYIKYQIILDKIPNYEDDLKLNWTFEYKYINVSITKKDEDYCIGNTTGWLNCSHFDIDYSEYHNNNSTKLLDYGIENMKYYNM